MGVFSRIGRWLYDQMDIGARETPDVYLRRALYLCLAGGVLLGSFFVMDSSEHALWGVLAGMLLVAIACGNAARPLLSLLTGLSYDGFGFGAMLALGVAPFALLALAPFVLIWNLVQAARAASR